MLIHQGLTDAGLNLHRRGLPPWSSEYHIRPLILISIQYSPFSPNCAARSPIMSFYQLFKFSTFHFTNQGIKGLNLVSGVYHSTSTGILSTKHSITNGFSTTVICTGACLCLGQKKLVFLSFTNVDPHKL
jgi:hypothetical protein